MRFVGRKGFYQNVRGRRIKHKSPLSHRRNWREHEFWIFGNNGRRWGNMGSLFFQPPTTNWTSFSFIRRWRVGKMKGRMRGKVWLSRCRRRLRIWSWCSGLWVVIKVIWKDSGDLRRCGVRQKQTAAETYGWTEAGLDSFLLLLLLINGRHGRWCFEEVVVGGKLAGK